MLPSLTLFLFREFPLILFLDGFCKVNRFRFGMTELVKNRIEHGERNHASL